VGEQYLEAALLFLLVCQLPAQSAADQKSDDDTSRLLFFYPNRIPSVGRDFWQIEIVSYFGLRDDGNGSIPKRCTVSGRVKHCHLTVILSGL
jgi:hypothetical protein